MGSNDRVEVRQNPSCEMPPPPSESSSSFQPLIFSTPYAKMMPAQFAFKSEHSPSAFAEPSGRIRYEHPKEPYVSTFTDDNYMASSDIRDYIGRPYSQRRSPEYLKETIGFQSRFSDDNYRASSDLRDYQGRPAQFRFRSELLKDEVGFKSHFTDDNYWLSSDTRDYVGRPGSPLQFKFEPPKDSRGYQRELQAAFAEIENLKQQIAQMKAELKAKH
ncbi:MAG TPA: hypothetical protein V6C89_08525 [Drouetiella sp.]|jgi:hypothetical protein